METMIRPQSSTATHDYVSVHKNFGSRWKGVFMQKRSSHLGSATLRSQISAFLGANTMNVFKAHFPLLHLTEKQRKRLFANGNLIFAYLPVKYQLSETELVIL